MVETIYQDGSADDIKEMARGVLAEFMSTFPGVNLDDIYFLRSSCPKPRKYFARIMCSNQLFKHFTRLPLIIEVNSDAFNSLDEKMQKIVVYHELLHIAKTKKGEYALRGHDIQEFSNVLETFGESVSINLHASYEKYRKTMNDKIELEKAERKKKKKAEAESADNTEAKPPEQSI